MRAVILLLCLAACTSAGEPTNTRAHNNCRYGYVVCRQEIPTPRGMEDFYQRLPGVTLQGGRVYHRGSTVSFNIDGLKTDNDFGLVATHIEYVELVTDPTETMIIGRGATSIIKIVTRIQ